MTNDGITTQDPNVNNLKSMWDEIVQQENDKSGKTEKNNYFRLFIVFVVYDTQRYQRRDTRVWWVIRRL